MQFCSPPRVFLGGGFRLLILILILIPADVRLTAEDQDQEGLRKKLRYATPSIHKLQFLPVRQKPRFVRPP
jgi:hypothetical protein